MIDLAAKHSQGNLSTLATKVKDKDLVRALAIVSEQNRPGSNIPVDLTLVHRDLTKIIDILETSFPRAEDLFELLLRRSNPHIQQLSLIYEVQSKRSLDRAIRMNCALSETAKNVCVHAVRTATNITYRDAMLLLNTLGRKSLMITVGMNKLKLSIRVTRMQFYKQHWRSIQAECQGATGKDFKRKMDNLTSGVFRDLMYAMASV